MTFAASPKSNAAKNILQGFKNIPGLTTIQPFPRFAYANALPFILEHSPLGYGKAFSSKTLEALASGKPEMFAKAASRATAGTLMLMSAWQIRQSEYAGERWYEIKIGDKTIDTRAFAPFSTYLFLAEALTKPEKLKATDFAQAAIGLNRVAGSGLVIVDLLRARGGETAKNITEKFIGQYAGSFAVPARTVKDFYSEIDPEEAIYRDTRENPLIAPFAQNIPGISQLLPEAISPLKVKRMKAEEPGFRQLTGLSQRTKTIVEKEVDKIVLPYNRIFSRTGIPEADRKISQYMAPLIEKAAPKLFQNNQYKEQSIVGKRILLSELFKDARTQARKKLALKNPKLYLKISIEGLSSDIEKVMQEKGIEAKKLLK